MFSNTSTNSAAPWCLPCGFVACRICGSLHLQMKSSLKAIKNTRQMPLGVHPSREWRAAPLGQGSYDGSPALDPGSIPARALKVDGALPPSAKGNRSLSAKYYQYFSVLILKLKNYPVLIGEFLHIFNS